MERLHQADDAFTRQLQSVKRHHEGEVEEMRVEMQREIDAANQRVRYGGVGGGAKGGSHGDQG